MATVPSSSAPAGAYVSETRYEVTGWSGWVVFGGVMMIIIGAMNAIYGLVALFNDEWTVWSNRTVVYLDLTQWGWVHLIVGGLVALAGIGVMSGNGVSRVAGSVVVALSMLVSFVALPIYPVWSLVALTLEALVLYALIAHGGDLARERRG